MKDNPAAPGGHLESNPTCSNARQRRSSTSGFFAFENPGMRSLGFRGRGRKRLRRQVGRLPPPRRPRSSQPAITRRRTTRARRARPVSENGTPTACLVDDPRDRRSVTTSRGGLSALGAGLYSIGIPKHSALQYETEVKNGKLLLVVHGSPEEVERAKDLLDQSHANSTAVHVERVTVDA